MWKTVEVAKPAVELLIENKGEVPPALPATDSLPHGEVVPMPRLLLTR